MSTLQSRSPARHWLGALWLSALLFALPLLALPAQAQLSDKPQLVSWPKGLSGGIRAGGIIGQTELASKISPQFRGFLRSFILPHLAAELGAGYGRLSGNEYSTDMEMGDLKLLFTPFKGPFLKPYFYGGVGLVRFNLDHIAQSRSPSTKGIDYTWTVPAGMGLELRLLDNVGLDLAGGYTHTFTDGLDAVRGGPKKDAFWNMSVGLVIRDITTVFKRAPRLVKTPAAPPVDTDGDGLSDDAEKTLFFTNPLLADSDGDGLTDREETQVQRTDPNRADTDGGTIGDGAEIARSGNALNAADDLVVVAVEPKVVAVVAAEPVVETFTPLQVYFGFDSATLTQITRAQLDLIASEMGNRADLLLDISGYTDSVGNRAYNMKLAEKRARAVEAYLVAGGIPAWRLHVQAMDQTDPLAFAAEDGKHRRVEMVFKKPPQSVITPTN